MAGAVVARSEGAPARRAIPSPSGAAVASTVALLLPAVVILVAGWSRRWVADDAFIDFRVVSNITSGRGPVFNPGERVEVFTDPLWVAILSVAHFLSFIPVEWWSVLLGLGAAVGGVVLGSRAAQLLGGLTERAGSVVLPIGMLAFVSVDAVWDFATSGLETGLIFLWLGLAWWLLARKAFGRAPYLLVAAVAGIGPLIRPDMGLITVCLLAACVILELPGLDRRRGVLRAGAGVAAALALPVVYEIWRMAYYALVVPNTALAKSAASTWWAQGVLYLRDFVDPYWLWIPLAVALAVFAVRVGGLVLTGDRRLALVLAAPVIGGFLDGLYVVRLGGDFMHARMLLPEFFAICLAFYVSTASLPSLAPGLVTLVWAGIAVAALHYPQTFHIRHGIANERALYVHASRRAHPITLGAYSASTFGQVGIDVGRDADQPPGPGLALVLIPGSAPAPGVVAPAVTPEWVVAPMQNIGIAGLGAGPHVYVFDTLSLANPIGSHLSEPGRRGRPGHSQVVGLVWMFGRFLPPGEGPYAARPGVADARRALSCGIMERYLHAITTPLTVSQMASNFLHALSFSRFRISADPAKAVGQLC